MKYGVPIYEYRLLNTCGDNTYNIGDFIQSYAIHEFYRAIGIPEEDIILIPIEELADYHGPYTVVLLNMYGGILNVQFSSHIIPVFWGFSYAGYIDGHIASILKKYEPIGCRDATTLYNVRSLGIESFLSGCITMTLAMRTHDKKEGKYFFIDVPKELESYIPNEILKKIEKGSHLVPGRLPFTKEDALLQYEKAIGQLNKYKNEATVVVTGRLHCASPCIAMGIPVIIAKKNRDTNMGWIEKVSPIYTPDMFHTIDWYPQKKSIEELKEKMKHSAQLMIQSVSQYALNYDLSYEFEESIGGEYNVVLINKLKKIASNIGKKDFCFAIWGLGDGGGIAFRLISKEFPHAKCIACVDTFKTGDFYNMRIQRPEDLRLCLKELDFIFLTTYTGRKHAVEYLISLGLNRDDDFAFLLSRVNGEDEYFTI